MASASVWIRGFSSAVTRPAFLFSMVALMVPVLMVVLVTRLRPTSTIVVNSTVDNDKTGNGFCTPRAAINNANAGADISDGDCAAGTGNDLITFSVSGSIDISATGILPDIGNTLTIDGTGQSITLSGADITGVM